MQGLRFKKTANEELAACLKYIKLNSETQLTTPNESTVSISFEEEFQSALVMQKLIKGRSVQLTVCQGLNKYRELISELQSMHQLEAVRELTASDSNILGVQKKRIIVHDQLSGIASLKRAKDPISEGMNEGKGTTMEFMLDFLDKVLLYSVIALFRDQFHDTFTLELFYFDQNSIRRGNKILVSCEFLRLCIFYLLAFSPCQGGRNS